MRLSLRSYAVLGVVSISLLTVLFGCATPTPVRELEAASPGATERAPAEAPSVDEHPDTIEDQPPINELPAQASVFLSSGLSGDFQAVIVGGAVAAGWFYPQGAPQGAGEFDFETEGRTGTAPSTAEALGLYASSQSLYLAHREAFSTADGGSEADGNRDTTQLAQLLPRSEDRRVRAFEPVELTVGSGRPSGFRARFSGDNRDEEIFVFSTLSPHNPPYMVRLPITAVRRTLLKDLTGDGVREMVHLSIVFDTMGRREIIVDALRWNSASFVHIGSVSLIRAINEQLAQLEARLQTDDDDRWRAAANAALQPIEEASPVAPLLPAERVQVPRITELSIDLSKGEWHFSHDIAVEENLYRLRIHLEANPLAEHPARIEGLQGR